jgi:hypothetical protein
MADMAAADIAQTMLTVSWNPGGIKRIRRRRIHAEDQMLINLADSDYSFMLLLIGLGAAVSIMGLFVFIIWREKSRAPKSKYAKNIARRLRVLKQQRKCARAACRPFMDQ